MWDGDPGTAARRDAVLPMMEDSTAKVDAVGLVGRDNLPPCGSLYRHLVPCHVHLPRHLCRSIDDSETSLDSVLPPPLLIPPFPDSHQPRAHHLQPSSEKQAARARAEEDNTWAADRRTKFEQAQAELVESNQWLSELEGKLADVECVREELEGCEAIFVGLREELEAEQTNQIKSLEEIQAALDQNRVELD